MLDFRKVEVGETINFAKDLAEPIMGGKVTFNLNWGKIGGRSVDLDAVAVFESRHVIPQAKGFIGKLKDSFCGVHKNGSTYPTNVIYFGNLLAPGVVHHGDDLTGAWAKGEYIEIDLDSLNPKIDTITFGVSSYSNHSFADLPFASISVFKGTPTNQEFGLVESELTSFNQRTRSVIMGRLTRNEMGEWLFEAMLVENTHKSVETIKNTAEGI